MRTLDTVPKIEAALAEACAWSNWYFLDQNWTMAEQWHLRAEDLAQKLHELRGTRREAPAGH